MTKWQRRLRKLGYRGAFKTDALIAACVSVFPYAPPEVRIAEVKPCEHSKTTWRATLYENIPQNIASRWAGTGATPQAAVEELLVVCLSVRKGKEEFAVLVADEKARRSGLSNSLKGLGGL